MLLTTNHNIINTRAGGTQFPPNTFNTNEGISMATPEVKNKVKPDITVKEPSMYKVIYVNDEQTTMEFVVESLVEHFSYTPQLAVEKTNQVHVEGAASVAVLPYEIAEQKGIEVTLDARTAGYPLQIKIEPTN